MNKLNVGKELPEFQVKEGFHTRFQQIDDATIQESVESGHVRVFHKNKDGVWEAKSPEGRLTLNLVGKNLFSEQLCYPNGSLLSTLYAPARKIREFFVLNSQGSRCKVEYMEEDQKGWRDHKFFDLDGHLVEEKISENWGLKKLVSNGKVLFDCTKSASNNLRDIARKPIGNSR